MCFLLLSKKYVLSVIGNIFHNVLCIRFHCHIHLSIWECYVLFSLFLVLQFFLSRKYSFIAFYLCATLFF
jgi:hypothetical protein